MFHIGISNSQEVWDVADIWLQLHTMLQSDGNRLWRFCTHPVIKKNAYSIQVKPDSRKHNSAPGHNSMLQRPMMWCPDPNTPCIHLAHFPVSCPIDASLRLSRFTTVKLVCLLWSLGPNELYVICCSWIYVRGRLDRILLQSSRIVFILCSFCSPSMPHCNLSELQPFNEHACFGFIGQTNEPWLVSELSL